MTRLAHLLTVAAAATFVAAAAAAAPPADPFSPAALYPTKPADAYTSYHNLLEEAAAWTDLSIFNGLTQTLLGIGALPAPPQGGTPFVVFAPTNEAFLRFLVGVSPPFEKYQDPTYVLATVGKLISAASDPDTPRTVIDLLARVVAYHISVGPQSEAALKAAGSVKTLLPGPDVSIDTSDFPRVVDEFNGTATRYGRSIKLRDDALLVVIDRVLQPFSLQPLRDLLFAPAEGSASLPDTPSLPMIPGVPYELQPFAHPNFKMGKTEDGPLPPAPFAYPFASYAGFLLGRSDVAIFSALVLSNPTLLQTMLQLNRTAHPLVPTDSAFINLVTMTRVPAFEMVVSKYQSDPFNPMLLRDVVALVTRVGALLPGLPKIEDIIAYHVLQGPADLGSRNGPQATLLGSDKLSISKQDGRFFIADGDSSRPDAAVIATFPLGTGYVSVIDALLTNFNVQATLAVLGANGGPVGAFETEPDATAEPADAESDVEDGPSTSAASGKSGSCFPGDARVMRADGSHVAMRDLQAGDAVRTTMESSTASRVFLFSHRDAGAVGEVVRLETASGHVVRATAGHYAYVDGRLRAFGAVRVGDRVRTMDGESAVVKTSRVVATGLYAPHALESDLVVDGVWVSAYSTAVRPSVAHALLAPLRWASRRFGLVEPVGRVLYGGADGVLPLIPRGAEAY